MTIEELKKEFVKFRDERDWKKFHNPKDLAVSISLEASELLELFQWKSEKEINSIPKEKIEEELADILLYCLSMSDILKIDLKKATLEKLEKNRKKYPAEKVKGKAHKYTFYENKKAD